MPNKLLFQCPGCATSLERLDDQTRCARCDRVMMLRDGIPCFTANEDYFFGEISADEMRKLACSVGQLGWEVAFDRMCARQTAAMADYIHQYIADASRANWKYLLRLPDDGRVLDFGCGWGETTISLSRSVSEVVSMDLTLERLLLLKARTADQQIDNVRFVHGGDTLPLPFADHSFDAVVLNGVLEWVPVTGTDDPRECQLAILREFRRVLRPSGQVYIGIENRFGLKYFAGSLDEHSQLKFTSLMPRTIANRYSRWRVGRDYRTYTYSRSGYLRLLQDAGFDRIDFFCPYPDYREFDRIVPVDNSEVSGLYQPMSKWKQVLKRLPGFSNLLRVTVPSFSIIAADDQIGESRLSRTLAQIGHQIDLALLPPSSYRSLRTGEILATCDVEDESTKAFIRIAETKPAIDSRIRSAKFLKKLDGWRDPANPCWRAIPRSLGYGKIGTVGFSVEDAVDGDSWHSIASLRKEPENAFVEIARWLLGFQLSTHTGEVWDPEELRRVLQSLVDQTCPYLPQQSLDRWLLRNHWIGASSRLPIVISHGDLHLGNALFSSNTNRIAGVIDWDLASLRGWPLVDLAYLILCYRMEIHGQSYGEAVQAVKSIEAKTSFESSITQEFLESFGLDDQDWIAAVEFAVLTNVATLACRRPKTFRRLQSAMENTVRGFAGVDRANEIRLHLPSTDRTREESETRRSSA